MTPMPEEIVDFKKELKEIKQGIIVTKSPELTFVVVLAVNKDSAKNDIQKISAEFGIPIGGYIHDNLNDCYIISCEETLFLETVPISIKLSSEHTAHWSQRAPVPEKVLKKYFTEKQKLALEKFETKYGTECEIHFLQLISPY